MREAIKKVFIIFIALIFFSVNIPQSLAKTFRDVPEDAWYYSYVEQLVSDGIIEKTLDFKPNEPQKRAELIKWVIVAINGLKNYKEPVIPTFDDVPTKSAYYKYIEAAAQLGIVIGYTDTQGNPLAKFGPNDYVNRAAATKILINSFKIPNRLSITPNFPDIKKGEWYYDYVITAYNYSILDGYENGKFGPGDPVTKAEMAKLIANAKNPVERTESQPIDTTSPATSPTTSPTISPATMLTSVWANDGGYKVTQDQLIGTKNSSQTNNSVWNGNKISIFGAKNEVVNFNLVLEAGNSNVNGLSVEFNKLTGPGSSEISSKSVSGNGVFDWVGRNIELFYVKYLEIKGVSTDLFYDNYDERHIPERMRRPYTDDGRGYGAWEDRPDHNKFYPDIAVPLELESPFSIKTKNNQSIWVDIYIPKNAAAGLYTGIVKVKENGSTTFEIPVELNVKNFTLPDIPSAKTMVYYSEENIGERYLGREYPEDADYTKWMNIIDKHFQLTHRHKISLIDHGATDIENMDERWVARLNGNLFKSSKNYDGPGVGIGNNIYSIGTYGSWWMDEGKNKVWSESDKWVNWFDSMNFSTPTDYFVYLIDESADYPQTEKWANWINTNPGLGNRLMSMATIWLNKAVQHTPSLDIPTTFGSFGITNEMQNAANSILSKPDKKLFVYNGSKPGTGSLGVEDDGVSLRATAWAHFKKNIDRWFYWESTYYNNFQGNTGKTNVFKKAQTFGNFSRIDKSLGETGGNYLNGDGLLVYPGTDKIYPAESYNIDGPIASLKLKQWRRGIQDVDYLTLAKQINPSRVNQIVSRIVPKVLWEYGVSDESDPTWVRTDVSWSNDPDVWETARKELADIIEGK